MKCIDKNLTFEEKELAIVRAAADKAQEMSGRTMVQNDETKKIVEIVENFIRQRKLVCYGGTAINNILPVQDQFYNKDIELPDYDFFSDKALADAKKLADIYAENGYTDVEAKAGVHFGTYKVFVNFMPVADITQLPTELFKSVKKEALQVNSILYAPPDYLRMSMYLELSRPRGDVSRWEKVLKRLTLLNKNYPMRNPKCQDIDFIRSFEGTPEDATDIYTVVRNSITDQGLVFFGGYASSLYSRYLPKKNQKRFHSKSPDFDALSEDPKKSAVIIKERLIDSGFENTKIYKRSGFGEIIAPHYEIEIDGETIAFIYKPLECHSYNTLKLGGKSVKVATIDTMLSFYLAFLYADRTYYDHDRILCMAQYLFRVQEKNRLEQKGVLRRFSVNCYGKQNTLEEIRAEKAKAYDKLRSKRGTKEYEEYFLRYTPGEKNIMPEPNITSKIKNKSKTTTSKRAMKSNTKTKTKKNNNRKSVKNKSWF
jgi:hypothetical protein